MSLVNELSTSSNLQNTVANVINMKKILCNGIVICNQATPLDDATQKESSRVYSAPFSFYMSQNTVGIIITYIAFALAAFSLGQAILGLLVKLQKTVCRSNPKSQCSLCQAIMCNVHMHFIRFGIEYIEFKPWASG